MPVAFQSILSLCVLCAPVVSASLVSGCQAPARTTRLQTRDFEDISSEVAASLRSSDFLLERNPDSPPITIAVTKVENLSTDLLSEGEKWYLIDRVVDSDAMRALREERAVRFVIPAEKLRLLREATQDDRIGLERRPTHSMSATIRSVTRAAGADRADLYAAFYRIVAIDSGEMVWTGEFMLKRAAAGKAYN